MSEREVTLKLTVKGNQFGNDPLMKLAKSAEQAAKSLRAAHQAAGGASSSFATLKLGPAAGTPFVNQFLRGGSPAGAGKGAGIFATLGRSAFGGVLGPLTALAGGSQLAPILPALLGGGHLTRQSMPLIAALSDAFSGAQFRQQETDLRIQRNRAQFLAEERERRTLRSIEDRRFRTNLGPTEFFEQRIRQSRLESARLQNRIGNDFLRLGRIRLPEHVIVAGESGFAGIGSRAGFLGTGAFASDPRSSFSTQQGAIATAMTRIGAVLDRLGSSTKQTESLLSEQLTLLRQSTQSKRQIFNQLNPAQRNAAIRLGGKLRRGEELTSGELREAESLGGLLAEQLSERRNRIIDTSGAFLTFLQEAGTATEKEAARNLRRAGKPATAVNLQAAIDDTKLVRQVRSELEKVRKEQEDLARRQRNHEDNVQLLQELQQVHRNAINRK